MRCRDFQRGATTRWTHNSELLQVGLDWYRFNLSMEGGRKLRSQMTNMNVSDTHQNPEVAESTEHKENVDNEKTMPGEHSTDQNVML